jgi:hypothetical protein
MADNPSYPAASYRRSSGRRITGLSQTPMLSQSSEPDLQYRQVAVSEARVVVFADATHHPQGHQTGRHEAPAAGWIVSAGWP